MSLTDLRYRNGRLAYPSVRRTAPEWILPDYLEKAEEIFARAAKENKPPICDDIGNMTPTFERLRWFPLPSEVIF